MGHADPSFTFRVYARAVKRRERLSGAYLEAFDQALEWAQMGSRRLGQPSKARIAKPLVAAGRGCCGNMRADQHDE
jgi:hypothetical protein